MVGESSIQSGAASALNAKTVQQQIRIVSADEKDLTRLGFINQDLAAQWAFCQVAPDFSSTSLDWPQARYGSLLNRTSADRRPISKVGSHVKINVSRCRRFFPNRRASGSGRSSKCADSLDARSFPARDSRLTTRPTAADAARRRC